MGLISTLHKTRTKARKHTMPVISNKPETSHVGNVTFVLQNLNHAIAAADLRDRAVLNSARYLDLRLSAV
jgi:hypothetical protein